jgi:hypothetical protein
MVRNGWVHPLLCASHPTKNRALSPSYLFRDEASFKDMFLKKKTLIKRIEQLEKEKYEVK